MPFLLPLGRVLRRALKLLWIRQAHMDQEHGTGDCPKRLPDSMTMTSNFREAEKLSKVDNQIVNLEAWSKVSTKYSQGSDRQDMPRNISCII